MQPGQGVALDALEADASAEWDAGALAAPASDVTAAVTAAPPPSAVAAWPAHLACAVTLGVACGLPMSRDADGPLWWWHIVRLWDLGGGGLVTAGMAWALVSAGALVSASAIWLSAGPARLIVLTASAVACIVLATAAWATGMACGAWTIVMCALVPASGMAIMRSADRPRVPARAAPGATHPVGGAGIAMAALGGISTILAVVAIFVRDGAPATACTLLMLVAGLGAVACAIRWRVAGPDEWTTLIPCGVIAMACGALACDGLAAMGATPAPPSAGTRLAALDSVRVIAVLLCQCALAYLAHRDGAAAPSAPHAFAPTPGMLNT